MASETVLTFKQFVTAELSGLITRKPGVMREMRDLFFGRKDGEQTEFLELGFVRVRGDGRCIIRALIVVLDYFYSDQIADKLGELGVERPKETEKVVDLLADLISKTWEIFEMPGCSEYHMDENAIDGLAVDVLMKILGISELKVFQFRNGASRLAGWRTKRIEGKGRSCRIATLNGCHYIAIL